MPHHALLVVGEHLAAAGQGSTGRVQACLRARRKAWQHLEATRVLVPWAAAAQPSGRPGCAPTLPLHLNWSMANCSRPGLTLPTASTASAMPPAHATTSRTHQLLRVSFPDTRQVQLPCTSAPLPFHAPTQPPGAGCLTSQVGAEEAPVAGELAQHLHPGSPGQWGCEGESWGRSDGNTKGIDLIASVQL